MEADRGRPRSLHTTPGQFEIDDDDGAQKYGGAGGGGAIAAATVAARVRKSCDDDDYGRPKFGRAFYSVRNDLGASPCFEL